MTTKSNTFNRREQPRRPSSCEYCGRSSSKCGCERDGNWTAPHGWAQELADPRPPRLDREHLRSLGL